MIFFDTNVLIYATINQGTDKLTKSEKLIEDAIANDTFFISPLILSEYIFILSKNKIAEKHHDDIVLYGGFVDGAITGETVAKSYNLCKSLSFCKSINDIVHLKIAEQYCDKLITFDTDFKKLQKYTDMKIEIL